MAQDNPLDPNRRDFLKIGTAAVVAGAAAVRDVSAGEPAAQAASTPLTAPPIENVRIGFVGVGLQGGSHVRNLVRIAGCRITAVCDIRPERTDWATKTITDAGHPPPKVYNRGLRDFERLCETEDLDLVYTATPWEWHVPVLLSALQHGKHAVTEVPAAMTVDDCWAMVEASEKFKKHCLLMENCNYDQMEMMVFNMVKQGLFGEILHTEGGYLHDLRGIKFERKDEGLWRRAWSIKLNGNPYPTHGLGPIANCLDINRGDRFDYLISMSSPSRGLQDWAKEHFAEGEPERKEIYALGDVNTSLIKTALGRTIMVQHCTNLPRPYSRIQTVQGTKGLYEGYPNRAYIEGRGRKDQWVNAADLLAEFEHPLWKEIAPIAKDAGHGGMDFIEDYRLIKNLREGKPTDQSVYDAAALSSVVELSCRSVAKKGQPVEVPDFTRGRWKTTPPAGDYPRMRTPRLFFVAAAIVVASVTARASGGIGFYGIVEKVVFEPNEAAAERIQIWGAFAYADLAVPGSIASSTVKRGYLYFKIRSDINGFTPQSAVDLNRKEWADLKAVAGTGQAIAFGQWGYIGRFDSPMLLYKNRPSGGARADLSVRSASESPSDPATYQTNTGIVKLSETGSHASIVKALRDAIR